MSKRTQTAIVLAAGGGTRFWPYSVVRNKVAFPICNVPVVRRLVDGLARLGISRIVVVVGQGEASVRAALRGAAGQISYVRQSTPEGTAAAAWLGASALDEAALADGVLILHGDLVAECGNLGALLDGFAAQQPLAAALTQPLGEENPRDWIVAHHPAPGSRGTQIEPANRADGIAPIHHVLRLVAGARLPTDRGTQVDPVSGVDIAFRGRLVKQQALDAHL